MSIESKAVLPRPRVGMSSMEKKGKIMTIKHLWCLMCALLVIGSGISSAEDWPMWRFDANRSAVSPQKLPEKLHLQWVRKYPRVKPAFGSRRLQFDAGYEPVVMGKTLFVGSPCNDTVTAIDTETGVEKWKFFANGPVRFAPVAFKSKVFAASDDGCLYCLNAVTGKLLWKFRAVPSNRKILGNGRMMSVWPVRGGPVLKDGRIYFAAGIWPFEGIFVYALDAETGKVIWLNDRSGSLYMGHPHGAWSFGGPSLQGYLLVNGNDLLVPNGTGGVPAYFDIDTGELLAFCHLANRIPGSWFVMGDPNGLLSVDPDYNRELHEDRFYETEWSNRNPWVSSQRIDPWVGRKWLARAGSRNRISVNGREYSFGAGFEAVEGKVCSMFAADGKMFIVTDEGCIYCFGAKAVSPKRYEVGHTLLQMKPDSWNAKVKQILRLTGAENGYTLVLGVGTGRLIEELAIQTKMHIIAVDSDGKKVDAFRRRLDSAGLYGSRVVGSCRRSHGLWLAPLSCESDCVRGLVGGGFISRCGVCQNDVRITSPVRRRGLLVNPKGKEGRLFQVGPPGKPGKCAGQSSRRLCPREASGSFAGDLKLHGAVEQSR